MSLAQYSLTSAESWPETPFISLIYSLCIVSPPQACREVHSDGSLMVSGADGTGVSNADFLLYVSAHDSSRCKVGTTVAYAAYCQLEADRDRYGGLILGPWY